MSDLIDRKLKKMDQDKKYEQVPFDERYMKKTVLKSLQKRPQKRSFAKMKTLLFPAAVVIFITSWPLTETQPGPESASFLTKKDSYPQLKTTDTDPSSTFAKADHKETQKSSMMVRETYVIHEDEQFYQTGKRVHPQELGEVIGTINHQQPAENTVELESVAAFLPETKIYKIKGEEDNHRIAIRSWRSTGVGSSTASTQGYFVFEKLADAPNNES